MIYHSEEGKWKSWSHGDGMTSCYWHHLQDTHGTKWTTECRDHGLKNLGNLREVLAGKKPVPFTLERFYYLLMQWIAVDDQVKVHMWAV